MVRCAGGFEAGVGTLVVLRCKEAEVFAEELATERGGEAAGHPGLTVHGGLEGGEVLDDDGDFGIVVAELRAVVEVGGAADDHAIVGDHHLFAIRGARLNIFYGGLRLTLE